MGGTPEAPPTSYGRRAMDDDLGLDNGAAHAPCAESCEPTNCSQLSQLSPKRVCVSDLRSADEKQTGRPQKKKKCVADSRATGLNDSGTDEVGEEASLFRLWPEVELELVG